MVLVMGVGCGFGVVIVEVFVCEGVCVVVNYCKSCDVVEEFVDVLGEGVVVFWGDVCELKDVG